MAKKKAAKAKKRPRKKVLWSPKAGLTNSAIKTWSECREQFALKYIDGWTSKKLSTPLSYGTIWHLLQQHQGKKTADSALAKFLDDSRRSLNPAAYVQLTELAAIAKRVFPYYEKRYVESDKQFDWIGKETQFGIPFNVLGEELYLRGQRDGVIRTKKGTLGLFETKTRSVIDQQAIANALRCDFQTLLYCWSLWKEQEEAPGLILYNVVKRPNQRKGKNERLIDYVDRIEADVKLNPSRYFMRWEVSLAPDDMARFEREQLLPVCQAFMTWWREVRRAPFPEQRNDGRHPSHYVNLHSLATPYGTSDGYDLVALKSKANYYRRSSPHPELAGCSDG